tara:strand:+ start:1158 stop:3908 length:2751 start_codon:yes stop_codon:yes gene_type:complete
MYNIKDKEEARKIYQAVIDGRITGKQAENARESLLKFNRLSQPSTIGEKAHTAGLAVQTGITADLLGAPVDLANFVLQKLGVVSEGNVPHFGSEAIAYNLRNLGMAVPKTEDLPFDQRAAARGGRTTGQALGMAAPFFGVSSRLSAAQAAAPTVASGSVAKNILTDMVKDTAKSPARMAALEGGASVGAGAGRTLAETVDPGNETLGLISELVGGIGAPLTLARTMARKTGDAAQAFTPEGRNRRAAKLVKDKLEEGGYLSKDDALLADEQVMTLAKQLRDVDEGFYGTTAQVTQDPKARDVFSTLESTLLKSPNVPAKVKSDFAEGTKSTAQKFDEAFRKMNNSTDPFVVKAAQEMRIEYFNKNLDKRLDNARNRMDDAISKALTKNPEDAVKASAEARSILDKELKLARSTESKLWNEVDKSVNAPTEETIKAFNSVKNEIGPAEQIVKPLEAFMKGLVKREGVDFQPGRSGNFRSAKELFRKRSVTLGLARQATATSRFNDARLLNKIADGMLSDLNKVTDATTKVAREFSRDLNEKFNTKFVRGLRKEEPGVLFEKATQGSDAQRAFNMQALKRTTERLVDPMEVAQTKRAMEKLQRDFMESAAARTVDRVTGQVEPAAFSKFIKNNQLTLKETGMLDDLTNIDKQVQLSKILQKTANDPKRGRAFVEKKSLAAQIRGGSDDLNEVVSKAFDSPHQVNAFRDLSRTVKRGKNADAMEGLRHAIFDELIRRSTTKMPFKQLSDEPIELISGTKLKEVLETVAQGKSVRQNLLDSGLISRAQSENLDKVIAKAKVFESAMGNKKRMDELIKIGDGLINLFARVAGSKVGANSAIGQIGGGSTLQAQAAFSGLGQKLLEKVPALKIHGVLTDAMRNPALMSDLLRYTPKSPKRVLSRINAYLLQAGLTDLDNQDN